MRRDRYPDGIAQRQFFRIFLCDALGHIHHPRHGHGPIEGIAKRHGNGGLNRHIFRMGKAADIAHHIDGCFPTHALIFFTKTVRGHGHAAHFIDTAAAIAAVQRPQQAALVKHQPHISHIVAFGQAGHHRFRIGHLRHPFGVHEAGDFDAAGPCVHHLFDQGDFRLGGHKLRLVLQAIARAHFHHFNGTMHDQTMKLSPQPHRALALGLSNTKPVSNLSSFQSMRAPLR